MGGETATSPVLGLAIHWLNGVIDRETKCELTQKRKILDRAENAR
jgi:hypothetical protein